MEVIKLYNEQLDMQTNKTIDFRINENNPHDTFDRLLHSEKVEEMKINIERRIPGTDTNVDSGCVTESI